jgi:hypothetical protein
MSMMPGRGVGSTVLIVRIPQEAEPGTACRSCRRGDGTDSGEPAVK